MKEELVEYSKTTMDSTTPSPPAPKITFFTLPAAKRPETPGMVTPPLKLPGSIPFMWEEAPGKPKREPRLPPSMFSAPGQRPAANHITSPTTVLAGPSPMNARVLKLDSSNNLKRNEEQEVRDKEGMILKNGNRRLSMSSYSSSSCRFHSFPSSSSSSPTCYCDDGGECGKRNEREKRDTSMVSVTRVRRAKSFESLSLHASYHLWARIYEGLKHVTRCRRSHKRS